MFFQVRILYEEHKSWAYEGGENIETIWHCGLDQISNTFLL